MRGRRTLWFSLSAMLGVLAGYAVAKRVQHQHREDLFSARPRRRRAALGWLEGHPSAGAAALLRDYLAWEQEPALVARAETLLHRLQSTHP